MNSNPTIAQTPPARHIAVIEDDETIREVITELLQDDGMEVLAHASGEAFLAGLDAIDPPIQVMIVDVKLGGIDGFGVAKAAREKWPDLPVVFISGDLRPLIRSSGRKDLCLMKPFTAHGLRQVLTAVQV